jgi:uncharacterized protein HemY
MVLYVLIFVSVDSRRKAKDSEVYIPYKQRTASRLLHSFFSFYLLVGVVLLLLFASVFHKFRCVPKI